MSKLQWPLTVKTSKGPVAFRPVGEPIVCIPAPIETRNQAYAAGYALCKYGNAATDHPPITDPALMAAHSEGYRDAMADKGGK